MKISRLSAQIAIVSSVISIFALILLHFLSPEFDPSWRMVSEYANGNFGGVLFIMFASWGIGSLALAYSLKNILQSKTGKVGLAALLIAGICQTLAAIFDIKTPFHDIVGNIGIPSFALAAVLISRALGRDTNWKDISKNSKTISYFVVASVVMLVISFIILMTTYMQSGADLTSTAPVTTLPSGVVALVGYANRFLVIIYSVWTIVTSAVILKKDSNIIKFCIKKGCTLCILFGSLKFSLYNLQELYTLLYR